MMISVEPAGRNRSSAENAPIPMNAGAAVAVLLVSALRYIESAASIAVEGESPDGLSGSLATAAELLRYACKQADTAGHSPESSLVEAGHPSIQAMQGANLPSIDEDLARLPSQILSPAGVEWDVFGQPDIASFPEEVQGAVLAILREVLVNTAVHAQAKRVTIHYFLGDSCFRMRVADDGRGFCLNHPRKSAGLMRIRDRAQILGGDLRVESAPWAGTRVVVTLPIAKVARHEGIPA